MYQVIREWEDGIPTYSVIHEKDIREFKSGAYNMGIVVGYDLDPRKMEKLADQLNSN